MQKFWYAIPFLKSCGRKKKYSFYRSISFQNLPLYIVIEIVFRILTYTTIIQYHMYLTFRVTMYLCYVLFQDELVCG